jgi:MoxR-like ATPase
MKPSELTEVLQKIVFANLKLSVMIWGPPGIGKSSIVAQIAQAANLQMIDLRLSQLAPTDLRGLPVADKERQIARWYPPEFLPREGQGILFLDEVNLAPPAIQGMAQQLILDRRVGSYSVPEGWFVWAAGNRKEDRAAVFDMPAPLANRFLHFSVVADLNDFCKYALDQDVHEYILSFLAFRPELLHKLDTQSEAWPSPRSWMMANRLLQSGILDISPAVGAAAYAEFSAFFRLQTTLPNVSDILHGAGETIEFPPEMDVRYALLNALVTSATSDEERGQAFAWLSLKAEAEWLQMYSAELEKRGLRFLVPQDARLAGAWQTIKEIVQ